MAERTTTPQLETLRKEQQKKKQNAVDPTHILDKAIYQLWETINDLDQIQPERVEHYRVSIFGSSRIRRGDPIYEEVKKLTYELAKMGIDIVWFCTLVAVCLQTAWLSPPVALSAYFLKGVVPDWELSDIYKGMMQFMVLQIIGLLLVLFFPELALWLPRVLRD